MKRSVEDIAPPPPAKRSRSNASNAAAVALVNSILANPKGYPISGNEDVVRKSLVDIATYARSLEQQLAGPIAGSSSMGAAAPVAAKPARTPAQLEEAAEKLRKAAVSGIKKQMSVSCRAYSQFFSHPCPCAITMYNSLNDVNDVCMLTSPHCVVEAFVQDWRRQVVV